MLKKNLIFFNIFSIKKYYIYIYSHDHSFETRTGGSTRDPVDPRLELGQVKEKIEEKKIRCDPIDLEG